MRSSSCLLALLALLAGAARAQPTEHPNVLFVVVDDLNTAVGFLSEEPGNVLRTVYPDPAIRASVRERLSPNLDALAASGVGFANAYATSPRCAPSRGALLTGIRQHVSQFDGEGPFRTNPVLAEATTLPQYLRRHGYFTAGVGKIFSNPMAEYDEEGALLTDWPDTQRSWDVWINREVGTDAPVVYSPWSPPNGRFRFGANSLGVTGQQGYLNASVMADVLRTGTGSLLDEALGVTQTVTLPDDQPFFLGVGLYRPHLPWIVPNDLVELFPTEEMALTEDLRQAFFDDTDDLSPGGMETVYRVGDEIVTGRAKQLYDWGASIDPENGPVEAWKEAVRYYLACVALADRIVGHLLDSLAEGPYANNTAVVLWGDHGFHLGEKTWYGKTTLWEESAQTPLVIRTPENGAPGVLRRQPVSLADVFPTLIGIAGVPELDGLGGVDLAALLVNPGATSSSTALTQMGADHHTLRTETYRYIRYSGDSENAELYHVAIDPAEHTNLIDDPAYASARLDMEARLDAALAVTATPTAFELPPPRDATVLLTSVPNPARDRSAVHYRLAARAEVTLGVFDALGRLVAALPQGLREEGEHLARLDTASWPTGTYTLRLTAGAGVATERLVVVR